MTTSRRSLRAFPQVTAWIHATRRRKFGLRCDLRSQRPMASSGSPRRVPPSVGARVLNLRFGMPRGSHGPPTAPAKRTTSVTDEQRATRAQVLHPAPPAGSLFSESSTTAHGWSVVTSQSRASVFRFRGSSRQKIWRSAADTEGEWPQSERSNAPRCETGTIFSPAGDGQNRWVFRKESAGRRLVPTIRRGLRSGRATSPPFGCAKTNQNAKLSRRRPQRPGMNRTREEQPGAHHPLHVRAPADPGPSDTPQCREDRQRPVRPKPGPGRGEHHPRGVITPRPQQPPQQLITPVTDRRGAARPTASGHKPDRTGAAVSSRLSRQRPSPAPCLPPSSNNEHPTSARNRECGPVTETDLMKRTVTADIDLDVTGPGRVVFQVAVVQAPGLEVDENLVLTLDGKPLSAREVVGVTGSRFPLVEPQPGKLLLSYSATVTGRADPPEVLDLSLIHISEPTRRTPISYAVF